MVGFFSKPKRTLRKMVKNGDYKEALEFGHSIAAKYNKDHDYLFIMGGIHYILDDSKNVFYYMDQALEINPFDVDALHLKASVYAASGEKEKMMEYCKKIHEIDPEHQGARELLDSSR
ncbi:MAG: TPR repeat-containing protein [Cenarchaeum symbiont of Oopsacas minuta]|nr:TPR repeat-containing protein [Cenarchaeum symbiont of Oopsacas minuta]